MDAKKLHHLHGMNIEFKVWGDAVPRQEHLQFQGSDAHAQASRGK
jgi:hypothetical protein